MNPDADLERLIGQISALELLIGALIEHHQERAAVAKTFARRCEKYVAVQLASATSSDSAREGFEAARDRFLRKLGKE